MIEMTNYEFWQLITIIPGGILALTGFLRSQELNKDSAFSEVYMHLSHESPVVRAAGASRLPSFYNYRRFLPTFIQSKPFISFEQPYKHQVLLLALSALKQELNNYTDKERRNFRQAVIDALGTILGPYSLGAVMEDLPSEHRGANLDGATLNELKLYKFRFDGMDCTEASFEKSDLGKSSFANCKLWKTNFHKSNLSSSNFDHADLWETDFSSANLKFSRIVVPPENFDERCRFHDADLEGAVLSENVVYLCKSQGCHNLHLVKDIVATPKDLERKCQPAS